MHLGGGLFVPGGHCLMTLSKKDEIPGKSPGQNAVDTDEWVDRYGDTLYRYALYRIGDRAIAEDLVQETFLAALNSLSGFASRSSRQTWLLAILKHKILDHYRHRFNTLNSRIDSSEDIDSSFNEKGEWRKQLEDWSELPDNDLVRKEFSVVLKRCLAQLPRTQRNVFVLREIDGFETEEICKDCSVSSTNLWVLLYRARKRLRDCLGANWFTAGSL